MFLPGRRPPATTLGDALTLSAPAPVSFLDNAADCIEAGDEIGRWLYLGAHAAGIPFESAIASVPSIVEETDLGVTSRQFRSQYPGTCAISGQWFAAGSDVYRLTDGRIVTLATVRAWEFTHRADGRDVSRWVRPTESLVLSWLASGRMIATLNNQGIKRYWKAIDGGKVEETSAAGGRTPLTNRKAVSAFWNTVAGKAQAVRVFG